MTIEIYNLSLVENAETVPLQFTLKLEAKESLNEWKVYVKSYMACNG